MRCIEPAEMLCIEPAEMLCIEPAETRCVEPVETRCIKPVETRCIEPVEMPCAAAAVMRIPDRRTSQIMSNPVCCRFIQSFPLLCLPLSTLFVYIRENSLPYYKKSAPICEICGLKIGHGLH